jgi:putative transposase
MNVTGSKKNLQNLSFKEKSSMLERNEVLSIRQQCALLKLNRSNYYYKPNPRLYHSQEFKETVMARLDYWSVEEPAWGVKTLAPLLCKEGLKVSVEFVRELRHQMGLQTIYPKYNTSKASKNARKLPYLLRQMRAYDMIWLPNLVWAIDITYIKMHKTHLYLAAIIDWYSRFIIDWELSDTLDSAPVVDLVKRANKSHGFPSILNSDQGSQFTSLDYMQYLRNQGMRQSMDGKGRWIDNVIIERWFRSLKIEHVYVHEYTKPRELRSGLQTYIARYNNIRPHQSLGNKTPANVYESCFV